MSKAGKTRRGFTLVEALTVVMIAGIVLPVVAYGISMSAGAATLVKQRTLATEIAENRLTEIVMNMEWQSGGTSGEMNLGGGTPVFRWSSRLADWGDDTTVQELTVDVTWIFRNQERVVSVSTLVYDTTNLSTETETQ